MAARGRTRKRTPEVPVSSFSDIAFLLIIYFILATTLARMTGVVAEIPSGKKAETKKETPRSVQLFADTIRPHHLRVTGLDEEGKPFDRVFTGFDAVVVHHEIDHLNGVLFIDRVEKFEDLYRLQEDEHGRYRRAPITTGQWQSGSAFNLGSTLGEQL